MKQLYLDANAHIPINNSALNAYIDFQTSSAGAGNPSAPSKIGKEAAVILETARAKIAELIGAKQPSQIVFTTSATHACEWGLNLLNYSNFTHISQIEHPAVSRAFDDKTDKFALIPVSGDGIIFPIKYPKENIICIYAQSEIGTIQPIKDLEFKCLFSDMTQALGKIPLNVSELNVDIATFSAHKFGGPNGVGFMYLKDTNMWKEFGTGSRYFMDCVGTPNVAGIVATAAALEDAIKTLPLRTENMLEFQSVLEKGLEDLEFEIIGKSVNRLANTTFAKVPCSQMANCGLALLSELNNKNIFIGLGSACGSLYTTGSPLMKALNRPYENKDYIRISQWGNYDKYEAEYLLDKIEKSRRLFNG